MRLPTNNIAITVVGIVATVLVVPIVLMLIYLLRFARGVWPHHNKRSRREGVLGSLEALSETHLP